MIVRPERADQEGAIRRLLVEAFPTPAEADLVERLRREGDARIALVAVEQDRILGHALFSAMSAPFPSLGLAPVAVVPDRRRQGIAAALIEEGIRRSREAGFAAVFVLGDPAYYGRFGFRSDAAAGFASPFAGPALMALDLNGAGLPLRTGPVAYAPAFSSFG
jgi:putative acetyltransferase